MAINILNLKRPCHFSLKRVWSFAYQVFCRMSVVCYVLRSCVRRFCNPTTFVRPASRNVLIDDDEEVTFSQETSCKSASNMAGVGGSATLLSQVWKRLVSFKRKLSGDSSVLPSAVLEMVTKESGSVLSQQSNSVEMPDHCSRSQKYLKLDYAHNITTSDTTVVVISEDCRPLLSINEESPESLEHDILPMGDELSALFDSDSQKEAHTNAATSSGKSNLSSLLYCTTVFF